MNGSVGHIYDNDLKVVSSTVNGANAISYAYDSDLLVTGVGAMAITRDPNHGLVTTTTLGVVRDAYTYNEHGEVTTYNATVSGASIYAVVYTRDDAGRITVKRETIQGVTTVYEYRYDTQGGLSDVLIDGVLTSNYEYDGNGNGFTG